MTEAPQKLLNLIGKLWPDMVGLEERETFFLGKVGTCLDSATFISVFHKQLMDHIKVSEISDLMMWVLEEFFDDPDQDITPELERLLGTYLNGETADKIVLGLLTECEEKEPGYCDTAAGQLSAP